MRRRIGFTGLECAALGMEHGTLYQQLIVADLDQTDILSMLPIERPIRFFTYQRNVVRTVEMHAVVHTEMRRIIYFDPHLFPIFGLCGCWQRGLNIRALEIEPMAR